MSDASYTLQQLEEQQKQRLMKQQTKKEASKIKKEENKKEDDQKEQLDLNICKCSVDAKYDNFDGREDELDLKVKHVTFICIYILNLF